MKKKGQVWVETVTYTLVAFVLIGLVLAFVKPRIDELQDKALIEQSLGVLKKIDSIISEVYLEGPGNKRLVEVVLKKGEISINSESDTLNFEFEGNYQYSEPGTNYKEGSFEILTTKIGPLYKVEISKSYPDFNITYEDKDIPKVLPESSVPYRVFIANRGGASQAIDFSLE